MARRSLGGGGFESSLRSHPPPRALNSGALRRDVSPKPAGRRRTTEPQPVAEIVQCSEPFLKNSTRRAG
jgi:hypothetical protein